MFIRQSINSYIRIYDKGTLGYITNQLTLQDRVYDETGADFLHQLSRQPQDVEEIVSRLCQIYGEENRKTIHRDFLSFAEDLARNGFVVMGKTSKELDSKDPLFTYHTDIPKTFATDFSQHTGKKVEAYTQDFLLRHDREHPRLACLQMELTSRCNERCIHCYIPNTTKDKGCNLSLERFKEIVDQYVAMNGLVIGLSGGEALMNKNFIAMLRYCREKDLRITLLSNLTLLTDEVAQALRETNVSLVQVSFYSMNPDVHDSITKVKGSFTRTKEAIEKLHDADVPVLISCPVMKANRKDYLAVMDYAHSLKMQAQTDYIMMAESNGDTSNLANRISIAETEELLRDMAAHERTEVLAPQEHAPIPPMTKEEFAEMPMCGAGINDLSMSAEGNVFPCSGWEGYVVGNVFQQPLREIWEQSPKLKFIRGIRHKDFPKCISCKAQDFSCQPQM